MYNVLFLLIFLNKICLNQIPIVHSYCNIIIVNTCNKTDGRTGKMSSKDYDELEKIFTGSWKYDRDENLEEFFSAVGKTSLSYSSLF